MTTPTNPLYFRDQNLFVCKAKILEIILKPEQKLIEVVLDQTCCYPKGGGQPGDQGAIESYDENQELIFQGKILNCFYDL